jgi:hypothetical protein
MQRHHVLTLRGLALRRACRRRYGADAPVAREILYVDPRQIRGERNTENAIAAHARFGQTRGIIAGGDWDRDLVYFDLRAAGIYRSCAMRWKEGRPWRDTPAYQSYLGKIEVGSPHHDAPTVAALDARYAALDRIYTQIVTDGAFSEDYEDLVTVTINRKGELFWGPNGRHRVCIALVLGMEQMPMRLGLVHDKALERFQSLRSHRSARMRRPWGFYG